MAEETPLSSEFNDNSPPPQQLEADAYAQLLEKLLGQGTGWGKTESVAAYFMGPMQFINQTPTGDEKEKVPVTPLYICMDLKEWPNTYGRKLCIMDIGERYGRRMAGEADLNAPDFTAPGIWTNRKKAFENDYIRRVGVDEYGDELHIWDPNPNAFRVCLTVTESVTIPTLWGAPWPVRPDGCIAVREEHVPALAAALLDIREGRKTAQAALFTTEKDGSVHATFDVYGMEPGFLRKNYKSVSLKPDTIAACKPFEPEKPATMNVLRFKTGANLK